MMTRHLRARSHALQREMRADSLIMSPETLARRARAQETSETRSLSPTTPTRHKIEKLLIVLKDNLPPLSH
jgi:hypothetical protein